MCELIEQFKKQYVDLKKMDLTRFADLYSDEIIFRDPVHELRGLVVLEDYMSSLCENIKEGSFEYLDQVQTDHSAYIKWVMHFKHAKLGDKRISVRGISQLQFDSRIYFQEDCYDMGALLYEHLPLIGSTTRWLKGRMAISP